MNQLKKYSKYSLLLIIFILFLFFADINLKEVWLVISQLKIKQIGFLVCLYFCISWIFVYNRKYLLSALGADCHIKNLILIHFTSMAAHYSTPAKIGFPLTAYLLKKIEQVAYSTGTALILIELNIGMGVCGVIAIIGSIRYFSGNTYHILWGLLFLIGMGIIFFLLVRLFLDKGNPKKKNYQFITSINAAFKNLLWRNIVFYTIFVFIAQVITGILLVFIVNCLSSKITLWEAIVANSTAFFLGALSMIPMGLGVNEATMLFFLNFFGIPSEIGIGAITLQRLLSTGLSYFLGLVAGSMLGIKKLKKCSNSENK